MKRSKDHIQNTKSIVSYLSYLRDISRKIISRNGFEKCLLNKKLNYAVQLDNFNFEDPLKYEKLKNYYNFLKKNHDKKLFIGFGTIIGTRKRIFAAPILTIQIELSADETEQNIYYEADIGTLNINYDLVSALSTNFQNEEDDVLNSLTEDENRTLQNIEGLLSEIKEFNFKKLKDLSVKSFTELKGKVEHFKEIKEYPKSEYNFDQELYKYTKRSISNGNSKRNYGQSENSIFENELIFINSSHIFLSTIPDELSTYEALNSFVNSIESENDFNNPVVEKLLINALTDESVEIGREPIEEEIQDVCDKWMPISMSNCQIQGLKNAWSNEISYIQGPPGTGKSHTISAIVLSAIALKKKVLILSQKTAALQVVNKKIEPYLTEENGVIGVCYYDTDARKRLKDYCNYLKLRTSNSTSFKREITILNNKVSELDNRLVEKLTLLKKENLKLEKSLEKQRYFKDLNELFLLELKRHNEDYFKIPNGFEFKKITNLENYILAIERLEKIWENNSISISTKLFIKKFKDHLLERFSTPEEWLQESTLPYFSKSFILVNSIYTDVRKKLKELNVDTNSLRNNIKNIKTDVNSLQKQLIKQKYKLTVLMSINDQSNQKEIDKFNSMLTNVNSRLIDKKMKEIDFHKITDVIPFWTAEIRHLGHLFPLIPDLFDLVIVDEASQVNLAEILPAFYRGKKLCIVGDHLQLSLKASGLTFSLGKNFDELTWEKYNRSLMRYQTASKKKLTVSHASILDFIKSDDYNVIPTEIMLDEHFRSLPKLARYTSKQFYRDIDNPDGKLKIMTEIPDKVSMECFQAVLVNGKRENETRSKVVIAEAEEVCRIIKCLTSDRQLTLFKNDYELPKHIDPNNFTIGVISMIRDQCTKILELIDENIPELDDKYDLMIGTPEEFQGNERDIMIFSLCLDKDCFRGQGHYQDAKRLNVATSRAKSFTYFVYSPFDKTFNEIYKYLHYIKGNVGEEDLIQTTDNAKTNDLPKLNYELFESDFEKYVYHYLEKYIEAYSNDNLITIHNQVISCGQKRLDFVLFNQNTRKSVAIEVDGSHHFINNGLPENYTIEHIERIDILKRAGWNIINTPYHKWYKNGWLSEQTDNTFKQEINRIYSEITEALF